MPAEQERERVERPVIDADTGSDDWQDYAEYLEAELQAAQEREKIDHREGVAEVYSHDGRYLGCIGEERWHELVAAQRTEEPITEDQYREAHEQGFKDGINCAVAWLRHADRLDEIPGARLSLPHFNPLWDAASMMEQTLGGGKDG